MDLGKRLKQARTEAGLSQRQLCGDVITRNMLSQIESGSARPSMDTLRYLAERLGKNMSYFLEEDAVLSPNQALMERARSSYAEGKWDDVCRILKEFREPDGVFHREKRLLLAWASLAMAEAAVQSGRTGYAAGLLEQTEIREGDYCAEDLTRRKNLLLAEINPGAGKELCEALPSMDRELLVRARDALDRGDPARAGALLEAVEDRGDYRWNFLRGEVYLALEQYAAAAACYHRAEAQLPEKTAARLEQCYRELEDYKMAYEYACRQR